MTKSVGFRAFSWTRRKTGENSHFKNALQPRWTPGFNSTSNPVLGKFAGIHGRPFEGLAQNWLVKRRPKPWRVLSDGGAKGRPGTGWRANMAIPLRVRARISWHFGASARRRAPQGCGPHVQQTIAVC